LAINMNYNLDRESKTYITPYPDDILKPLNRFKYIDNGYPGFKVKGFKFFNDMLATSKGLYDAIEILIGKKPEVKVIKEVREVILTVREKSKPQPKSTKFICFNCDTEYDKPIKICENCGFQFKSK